MSRKPTHRPTPAPGPTSGVRSSADGREAVFRVVGVRFVNEAARSWGEEELVDTCRALLASGYIVPRDPLSGRILVREGSLAPLTLHTSPWTAKDPTKNDVAPVLRAANFRVVQALRGLKKSPQDDRFLNAAIHGGRVTRVRRTDATMIWQPCMAEGESLSDWILALFAADAMRAREDYDTSLQICDACGFLTFVDLEGHPCASDAPGRAANGGSPNQ